MEQLAFADTAGASTTMSVDSHRDRTMSAASASAWSMVRPYSKRDLDGAGYVPALIQIR